MTRPLLHTLTLTALLLLTAAGQTKEPVILQNADIFSGRRLDNGEDVRELEGNVRFRQGNVRVWCDRAVQYLNRNEIELNGNVRIVRDTVTLTSRKGRYYGDKRRADGEGNVRLKTPHVTLLADIGSYDMDRDQAFFQRNVRVIDSSSTIHCEQLTYFERERRTVAMLNVRIVNPSDNVTMYGHHLVHLDSTGYSRMTEEPRLLQIDTAASGEIDTLAVRGVVMESFDDSSQKLVVTDSVVIVRGAMAARCGLLLYHTQQERIELFSRPVVWYDENQVTGDTILLHLRDDRLVSAAIRTRAFVASLADSAFPLRYNQLTGRSILLRFEENKLRETLVERNAVSLYFLFDEGAGNGVNKTTGDFIRMLFEEGRPKTIHVAAGIEGTYVPETLLERNGIGSVNLDGFMLRNDRPDHSTVFPPRK